MIGDFALVADIGGTNARFALAEISEGAIRIRESRSFLAKDFISVHAAANAYLASVSTRPVTACFAVAGPVTDAVVEFTNSPWLLDIAQVKSELAFDRLIVVNDFEALARSVRHLEASDFVPVRAGAGDPDAPVLVLGPGTGFGQALIIPFDGRERIISTQGGHVAFAPCSDEEMQILQFIAREHPRVSIERLLSGAGLVNIHRALCSLSGAALASLGAEEITRAALTRRNPAAISAVDVFCRILGAAAGDAVLATGARGGVVLGGGILPQIKDALLRSGFVDSFLEKGRMRNYVEDVPVDLMVREGAALIGAAALLREA